MLKPKRNLSTDLVWRISIALALVAGLMGLLHYQALITPMEEEMEQTASTVTEKLADNLREHLWNLDEPSVSNYFSNHPLDRDVAEVRLVTQFDEPLYQIKLKEPLDPLTKRKKIHYDGEEIGELIIVISRDRIEAARANIIRFNLVLILLGVVIMIFICSTFLKVFLSQPLHHLVNEMKGLASGNYESRLPDTSRHQDISMIYREANAMADKITERTRRLQQEIAERRQKEQELQQLKNSLEDLVSQRAHALTESNKQLRLEVLERVKAQAEILQVSTQEQQRIGRDLHDSIGQHMVASYFSASALADRLKSELPEAWEPAKQVVQLLNDSIVKIRRVARGLTGVELENEGLVLALQQLAQDTEEVFDIRCRFQTEGGQLVKDRTLSSHLYLITQEAVNNAIRHGKATGIDIKLYLNEDHGRLTITDNGTGLAENTDTHDGIGLHTMRYRAEAVDGTLAVEENEWGGTTVACRFPTKLPAKAG